MDLPLTGAEATALRACAKREARSKQDVARHAVREYVENPYQTVEEKAAALLHSLVRNHKLIDGNRRMALAATIALLGSTDADCGPCRTTRLTSSLSKSRRVSWTRFPASPTASDVEAKPATGEDQSVPQSESSPDKEARPSRLRSRAPTAADIRSHFVERPPVA
jgi:hypothetical protein